MASYALWDTRTGNRLGVYGTEEEALAVVRELVSLRKSARARRVEWLSLVQARSRADLEEVASGLALAERAFAGSGDSASALPRRRRSAA